MPTRKILAKAELNKKYPENQYIESNIQEVRKIYNNMLKQADEISDQVLQAIYLFSIIDCFAQEYKDYPVYDSSKAFCDFIIQFQGNRYTYLQEIEPVTLFYDIEEKIDKAVSHPELLEKNPKLIEECPELFLPKMEVTIDDLGRIDEKPVKDIIFSNKSNELIAYIEKKATPKKVQKLKNSHTFLKLIYTRRSKLVHEMSRLGGENSWEIEKKYEEPYYREMGRMYEYQGNIVYDNVYQLVIPNRFIYNLATECVKNYLDYCSENKRYPFKNNMNFSRRVELTWTDYPVC